ncbi:RING finger protein nhl-1 isoform X7 [Drosophila virilis]|uniref:RING finger protein nhl-1 isoform X7 n=1 Tax=Drosophila virilis TaxID=7244 RepID=UPI0013965A9F|nr:RING finger protein nhl-1 isoform X7 [Drosophila virilis]
MEQFEQLLTCCVCLDRYRIPKLLPCQHSFCMEPCMEGLVDYVRRQVKCPECRAEHRIPYNGVQAFPTNVTLQRFLELHIEITGELPDPTSGQIMERCGVCSEKAYLSHCAHCEKKICEDCKSAHMDILRREITRFNSQIRRSLHRLQDSLAIIEKNTTSLQTNAISVTEEIDEIYRRITKAIKDRSDGLKGEIDRYLAVELRNLTTLKENLDLEITNISSNCDIVDKYMNETVEWDDCELMDTKEIFLKTVEFLRHFEYENNDYSRRVRFLVSIDPNQLVMNLATFGDLNIAPHSTPSGSVSSSHLAPPSALQPGLMRSKSDHRLATQFRQQEERSGYNDEPVLGGRKFGERPQRSANNNSNNSDRYGDNRYGRSEYDYDNDYENEPAGRAAKSSRFRSRFVRSHQNEDSDSEQQQQQRQQELDKRKDRVLDSEDVSRGQLSGIIRLSDCQRVVQRLADIGKEKKEKKSDAAVAAQAAVQAAIQAQKAAMQRQQQKNQPTAAAATDEDELARQKRKNTAAGATGAATSTAASGDSSSEQRPNTERVAALRRGGQGASEESDSSSNNQSATAAASPVRTTTASTARAEADSATDSDATPTPTQQSKPAVSAQVAAVKKTQRSGSSDSSASTESSASSAAAAAAAASAAPSSSSNAQPKAASTARYSSTRESTVTATPEKKPFVSRFLPQHSNPSNANGSADKKKAESESSSEEETSSESESESEAESKPKTSTATSSSSAAKSTPSSAASSTTAAPSAGSSYRDRLEARRASRDDTAATTRSSYATPNSSSSGYGSSSSPRTRPVPAAHHLAETEDRYGSGSGSSSSALPFSIPYISRPYRARYRKRLADVLREIK